MSTRTPPCATLPEPMLQVDVNQTLPSDPEEASKAADEALAKAELKIDECAKAAKESLHMLDLASDNMKACPSDIELVKVVKEHRVLAMDAMQAEHEARLTAYDAFRLARTAKEQWEKSTGSGCFDADDSLARVSKAATDASDKTYAFAFGVTSGNTESLEEVSTSGTGGICTEAVLADKALEEVSTSGTGGICTEAVLAEASKAADKAWDEANETLSDCTIVTYECEKALTLAREKHNGDLMAASNDYAIDVAMAELDAAQEAEADACTVRHAKRKAARMAKMAWEQFSDPRNAKFPKGVYPRFKLYEDDELDESLGYSPSSPSYSPKHSPRPLGDGGAGA